MGYAFSATLEYGNCSLDAIVLASCDGDLMAGSCFWDPGPFTSLLWV